MKQKRILVENASSVYHVISRTAFKRFCFDDVEKQMFCRLLEKLAEFAGVEILSYCILSNHFHLLVRVPPKSTQISNQEICRRYTALYEGAFLPPNALSPDQFIDLIAKGGEEAEKKKKEILSRMHRLPVFIKELKQRFGIWYNKTHENKGTIWEARYKSVLLENCRHTLKVVTAYIDLNPVRAGICQDPREYTHSSFYRACQGKQSFRKYYMELFDASSWKTAETSIYSFWNLDEEAVLSSEGGGAPKSRQTVASRALRGKPLSQLLKLGNRYFCDGGIVGSAAFIEQWFSKNPNRLGHLRSSGARKISGDWEGLFALRDLKKRVFSYCLNSNEAKCNKARS